jgi:SNF2 family DNA or RNA helicase
VLGIEQDLNSLIRPKIMFTSSHKFIWSANENGLAVRFSDLKRYAKAKEGRGSEDDQIAFIRIQMLAEDGEIDAHEVENGIFVETSDAVRLDSDTREGFLLPPKWPGGLRLQTDSVPQLSGFRANLGLVDANANVIWNWELRGPILEASNESYLPTSAQFVALKAYSEWNEREIHDEFANLSLLATLRDAWNQGCHIHLETYEDTIVSKADELAIDVREESETGDLILRPVVNGDFPELDADMIEERLAQLNIGEDRTVLRVGKTIVLLNQTQTKQARALAINRRVPSKERDKFEKNPSAWLSENVFPEIDSEFSPRVTGIGVWKTRYLGANWEEGQDWFAKQPTFEKPAQTNRELFDGRDRSEEVEPTEIGTETQEPIVPLIIPNDEELGYGWRFPEYPAGNQQPYIPNFERYARSPKSYQEKAVRWLLENARRGEIQKNGKKGKTAFGSGVLLADEMGLGKTFSTLIFLSEWLEIFRETTRETPPAVLVVAPLSLLENWKDEIDKSYRKNHEVFTRVIVAQGEGDLKKVRMSPHSKDIAEPGKVVQYGLRFGDGTEHSLDYPGSCVLTTYQTLRKYRFSFAKAEWSTAIFDEAQSIKNPNALQTISAKALKAFFRIAMTGTPVENHLGDFWCILDTVEPGHLGSFADFKQNWIFKMKGDPNQLLETGKKLRDHVGGLMLRRTKDDVEDLPPKKGADEPILVEMSRDQIDAYNQIIFATQDIGSSEIDMSLKKVQNRQLGALWQLRRVSLHPDLLGGGNINSSKSPVLSRMELQRSGKLNWLLECLDKIKDSGEKVLIFCVLKKLQESLAFHLGKIYDLNIPVINGDTKTRSRLRPETSRLGLIKKFCKSEGFGICILSPIAAGAGLNIVEANHVIHLERHWSPAKEDQATDRVYRIGQEKEVKVYLPTTTHPHIRSFDLVLHGLLEKKRELQSALGLIPPESVSAPELLNEIFARGKPKLGKEEYLDLKKALKLSWRLFEALIATIYADDSERVILTPGGSDHGCDVVVIGYGKERENILIQCKKTARPILDSQVAVRDVEGSRPFYEKALNLSFNHRRLHTTAKTFSRRTRHAADICGVALEGRAWLGKMLDRKQLKKSAVLSADLKRESVM